MACLHKTRGESLDGVATVSHQSLPSLCQVQSHWKTKRLRDNPSKQHASGLSPANTIRKLANASNISNRNEFDANLLARNTLDGCPCDLTNSSVAIKCFPSLPLRTQGRIWTTPLLNQFEVCSAWHLLVCHSMIFCFHKKGGWFSGFDFVTSSLPPEVFIQNHPKNQEQKSLKIGRTTHPKD